MTEALVFFALVLTACAAYALGYRNGRRSGAPKQTDRVSE
jgi:hypothetical protein